MSDIAVADEDADALRALDSAMPTMANHFRQGLVPLPGRVRHLRVNRSRPLPGAGGHINWRALPDIDTSAPLGTDRPRPLKFDVVFLAVPELLGLRHADSPARTRRCASGPAGSAEPGAPARPCDDEDDRLVRHFKNLTDVGGALVVDSGPDEPRHRVLRLHAALARHFAHVYAVTVHTPISGGVRVLHYATSNSAFRAPRAVGAREVDLLLQRRLGLGGHHALRSYDGFLHRVSHA